LNVKVNAKTLKDKEYAKETVREGEQIKKQAIEKEEEILKIVEEKMAAL
jgi:formiminotetrahydrofolate cyclodeaminase